MAQLQVDTITLTDEQTAQISSDGTGISIRVEYDDTPPAGYRIVATGPLGSVEVCAKPCSKVTQIS
ncbi:hypothetical protein FC093_22855 [Ilyomonas limi]|uniref:Uncharacterized protein n=1 Tax=Ilyomonas limi TaxID=2575867 RepID=A0A4U3KQ04_9BACT|nr:hypothetical protein [Ilyomonas limi]TKK64272.1 hypothetical protein FC093_22855 [Ilyomonas limi]